MKCYIQDYPRPQFVRDNWVNLNGAWDFQFDDKNCGEKDQWFASFPEGVKIQVPFTYETVLSGIGDETVHNYVWYKRIVSADPEQLEGHKAVLNFEGSDYITKVWVNGCFAGCHTGGYSRFSFDVTNLMHGGDNEIVVKAEDSLDARQSRGKQRWLPENFGCWYVQTTGIWKTVWMEYTPVIGLAAVKMTPVLAKNALELEYTVDAPACAYGRDLELEAVITFDGAFVARNVLTVSDSNLGVTVDLTGANNLSYVWGVRTWSPDSPDLYDIEFKLSYKGEVQDEIGSYFGMREIRIDGPNILLNGHPLYQRLILDQGYWRDSHLTPPSEAALIEDIDKIHALGYNGLRKHQKIEDERFLYWCDVKGMLVWSEAAAFYSYSDYAVKQFTKEWIDIVEQNYNHPSIITWTPVNESWGVAQVETDRTQQHFTEAIYHLTKSLDKNRPVIVNDGWEHTVSDIITLHDYEEVGETLRLRYTECKEGILDTTVYHSDIKSAFANGFKYQGQPVIISEFGGIAFNNDDSGWGYGNKVNTEEDFIRRFDNITTAVKELPYVCGYCYTQVSDVQQEINGLMDIDRNFKADPAVIKEINERKVGYWRSNFR